MAITDIELLRFGIALAGCAAATCYDLFNNRNVPNLLTYSLVAIGLLFGLSDFASATVLSQNGPALLSVQFLVSFIQVFGPALFFFLIGYYLYANGQIGGADVLVFVAIALLVQQQPTFLQKNSEGVEQLIKIPYVVSVFLLSGVLFSAYLFLSMFPKVILAFMAGKVKLDAQRAVMSLFILVLCAFFFWSMYRLLPLAYLLITAMVVISAFFVYIFRDYILDEFVIRNVPLDKIDEEDVLALEKLSPDLVKKYDLKKVLTAKELEKLKSVPLKEFPIYKNMNCYMPHVLLAILITLFTGDIFSFLMRLR